MNYRKLLGILVLVLTCNLVGAESVTKTLSSPNGDKVSITYNISQKNGKVTIQFTDVRHALGELHKKKNKNDDNVVALFFSRNGSFNESGTKFQGESTKAFISPAGLTYNRPVEDDGFYIASKKPTLAFDSKATEAVTLSIPFYLATHPKKGVYDIFENCGSLGIPIVPEANPQRQGSQQKTIEYTVEEEESSFSFEEEARQRIAHINTSLDYQEGAFSQDLINEIANLAGLKEKVKDKNVLKAIDETLAKCDQKREELKQQAKQQEAINEQKEKNAQEDAEFRNCRTIEDYEHFLNLNPDSKYKAEAEKNRDELKAKKEEEDGKQKKRTIWMIIGGALLAVLLFVGNQVMQNFRNIKTQRSIMQMQQNATRQVTGNAKRRVAGIIHNKTHQAMNVTRNKGKTLVQKGVEKTKNASAKKGSTKAKTIGKKTNSNKQVSI
jgi:hypothetical protein